MRYHAHTRAPCRVMALVLGIVSFAAFALCHLPRESVVVLFHVASQAQGMKDLCAALMENTTLTELSCDYNVSKGLTGRVLGPALKATRLKVQN